MILFQVFLMVVGLAIIIILLRGRSTLSIRAWKKLGLISLALLMIVIVLWPELATDIAHWVGIGRGTDLLLYMTVVAFILYVLNEYLYKQDQRDILFRLARKQALYEANERYKKRLEARRK